MIWVRINRFRHLCFCRNFVNQLCHLLPSHICSPSLKTFTCYTPPNLGCLTNYTNAFSCYSYLHNNARETLNLLTHTHLKKTPKIYPNTVIPSKYSRLSFYSSYLDNTPARSIRKRAPKKSRPCSRTPLNAAEFQQLVSQLPPRFTTEDFCRTLALQNDPQVCIALFNWASQQPRFKHDISTYHITIKKLGSANMYEEMDYIINQVLAIPDTGSEVLFNTIIYFCTEARKLSRAVNVYKHMRRSKDPGCRPSIRTYNLLFTSLLSRGSNTYINHMYMETIRCLFKQMVNDGTEPDIFSLNCMIKGYVLSLHINDALRIFHQIDTMYNCQPNSHSYDYLIHGLCAQGRTNNAKELFVEMKNKGYLPSSKAYNSLVNSLAIGGEVDEAVRILWEMTERRRPADYITYQTVLDEICRQGRVGEGMRLLKEWQEKDVVDGHTYRKLLYKLEDDYGNSNDRTGFR